MICESKEKYFIKTSPYFYVICKKCGSDEMYFKGSGEFVKGGGIELDLVCNNCNQSNEIDEFWIKDKK